jgi:DNA polymerase III delta prime subunit
MDTYPLWNQFYQHFEEYIQRLPRHKYITEVLFTNDIESSPNILLYGPHGFPHTLLMEYAISKFLSIPFPIQKRTPVWNQNFPYIETDYYFELDLGHPDFPKDIQDIIDFLLTIIRNKCIHLSRHMILLKNIDLIHNNNSQAFRVILERFSNNVLFIASTHRINKLEPPLLSRMQLHRVPLLTEEENKTLLHKLTNKTTIRYYDQNIVKNIFFNEPSVMKKIKTIPTLSYPPLKEIIDTKVSKEELRKFAFKLFQQNIPIRDIVMDLLSSFQKEEEKHLFLQEATNTEHLSCISDPSKMSFYIEHILHMYYHYKHSV